MTSKLDGRNRRPNVGGVAAQGCTARKHVSGLFASRPDARALTTSMEEKMIVLVGPGLLHPLGRWQLQTDEALVFGGVAISLRKRRSGQCHQRGARYHHRYSPTCQNAHGKDLVCSDSSDHSIQRCKTTAARVARAGGATRRRRLRNAPVLGAPRHPVSPLGAAPPGVVQTAGGCARPRRSSISP